jgi:hypothetical protein
MHAALYVKQKDHLIFTLNKKAISSGAEFKTAPRTEQPAGYSLN